MDVIVGKSKPATLGAVSLHGNCLHVEIRHPPTFCPSFGHTKLHPLSKASNQGKECTNVKKGNSATTKKMHDGQHRNVSEQCQTVFFSENDGKSFRSLFPPTFIQAD